MRVTYEVKLQGDAAHVVANLVPSWFERLVLRRRPRVLEYQTNKWGYDPRHYPSGREISTFGKPCWRDVHEAIEAVRRRREWAEE